MPIETLGFQSQTNVETIQAEAMNLGGYVINRDYVPEILDYRRTQTVFWQLLKNKKPAPAPIVRRIYKDRRPHVGFVTRHNLSAATENHDYQLPKNLNDPGQEVKAVAATLDFSHFARSMHIQQGRPYGDSIAEDTQDLIVEAYRFLEMSLFRGDAAANDLEFNGLQKQLTLQTNIDSMDITTPEYTSGDSNAPTIWRKINQMVMRATSDRETLRRITHIFMTPEFFVKFQEEIDKRKNYVLQMDGYEVIPGVVVPAVMTGAGLLPIITSVYLDNIPNQNGADVLRCWLINIDEIEWYGVYPDGGDKTFEPQIFDVTNYLAGQYLVIKRFLLMYGTPYLKNNALWRLDMRAPLGSAWNVPPQTPRVNDIPNPGPSRNTTTPIDPRPPMA